MGKECIGARIAEERKRLGLSQAQLAKQVNISQTAVAKQETGANYPSIETLEDYANLFNVTTDYLLGRTDERKVYITENPPELADIDVTEVGQSSPFTDEQLVALKEMFADMQKGG